MTDQAQGSADAGNPGSTSAVVAGGGNTSDTVAPPAAAPAAPNAPEWLKGADELTIGYVQNKGWTEPAQVLEGYRNLEKLFGADKAGRTVVLPGEKAEAAEIDAFYNKLGRPADAKDYKVEVPEGAPPEYAAGFRETAHKLGLTAKQVEGLAAWNNEFAANAQAAQSNQTVESFNRDVAALKQEWGAAHDQNLVLARNVVSKLGWDSAKIDAISGAIGHAELMRTLVQLGAKTGEAEFVSSGDTNFGGAKTPAAAKAEIAALRQDKEFMAKYMNKDAEAVKRFQKLHQWAYPE